MPNQEPDDIMQKTIAFLLMATTSLATVSTALADAAPTDPFFWIDTPQQSAPAPAPAPQQRAMPQPVQEVERPMERRVELPRTNVAPPPVQEHHVGRPAPTPPPMQHPTMPMPNHSAQAPLYYDGDCVYPDGRPATLDFPYGTQMHGGHPHDQRRGYATGDDGILRAIQDNPCVDLRRRGGETAQSASGWSHPDDIRRANTLEMSRVPNHTVGRWAPQGSGNLWQRDPSSPFVDSAKEWDVRRGEYLSSLLSRWGDDGGWTVVYQADSDYILQADVIVRGTFPEASGQIIESFANANPPIRADVHLGNRVLVVRSGNEFDGR